MATIAELMPYLDQGYQAHDPARIAFLRPLAGGSQFEWTAYEWEGEWSSPTIYSREAVLAWSSHNWQIEGIEIERKPDNEQKAHGAAKYLKYLK